MPEYPELKNHGFAWTTRQLRGNKKGCPGEGGKTARKDIGLIAAQEAKAPGKTSGLSRHRRQNNQERYQSYPGAGGRGRLMCSGRSVDSACLIEVEAQAEQKRT